MDELFGGLFVFDHDGDTDSIEFALGLELMYGSAHSRGDDDWDEDPDFDDVFYDPLVDDDF